MGNNIILLKISEPFRLMLLLRHIRCIKVLDDSINRNRKLFDKNAKKHDIIYLLPQIITKT